MAEDEVSARVGEILRRIADAVGVDVEVRVAESADGIEAEYVGSDVARLIGHRGQTIDAIQHLVYRIAFLGATDRRRISVDASGYRERRAATLRGTANQAAEAAVRDGRPVALEPMSAHERKVVHEHLKSRHDIETYSEGQEPSRRLVVAPLGG